LYPKGVSADSDLISQWRDGIWNTTLLGNGSPEVFPLMLQAIWTHAGPIQYLGLLAIFGLLIWLLLTGALPGLGWVDSVDRRLRFGLAVALLGAGTIWGVIPFAVETEPGTLNFLRKGYLTTRFGVCFLNLTSIALVVGLSDLSVSLGRLPSWLGELLRSPVIGLALVGLACQIYHHFGRPDLPDETDLLGGTELWLFLGVDLFLTLYLGATLLRAFPAWRGVLRWSFVGLLMVCVGAAGWYQSREWHTRFDAFYRREVGDETFSTILSYDPSSTKICTLAFRGYPLFGSYRQFRICSPLWIRDDAEFLAYVWNRGVTYVILDRYDSSWTRKFARMEPWLVEHPEVFSLAVEGTRFTVYRVDRESLQQALARQGRTG
jgi:hypothetical protein